MSEYDNENRGVLFRNDDKQEDWHADYRGSINIAGCEHYLDAWINEGKPGSKLAGRKYLRLKIGRRKEGAASSGGEVAVQPEFDDEIPF